MINQKKYKQYLLKSIFVIVVILVIIFVVYSNENNDKLNIDYGDFLTNNYVNKRILQGKYLLLPHKPVYHFNREDYIILYENIPKTVNEQEGYIFNELEKQILLSGWKTNSNYDSGNSICYLLIPEYQLLWDNGVSIHAYRKENFKDYTNFSVGDVACLVVYPNSNNTYANIIQITAEPTLFGYLEAFISQ